MSINFIYYSINLISLRLLLFGWAMLPHGPLVLSTYRKMERPGKKCCQMLSCLETMEQSYRRQPRSMMRTVDSMEVGFDWPFRELMYAWLDFDKSWMWYHLFCVQEWSVHQQHVILVSSHWSHDLCYLRKVLEWSPIKV